MKELGLRLCSLGPGRLLLAGGLVGEHHLGVLQEVLPNDPELLPAPHAAAAERHLENLRGSGKLSAVNDIGDDCENFCVTIRVLNCCPKHHPTLCRLFLGSFPVFAFGKTLFDICKSFLEDPDAVTDDRVLIDRICGDLDDVGAVDLELLAGPRVLPRHPTHLVEEMRTSLAGVSPDKYLDLGWFVVTLDLDRRKTGSRFVLNGSPTALSLISDKNQRLVLNMFVDHDLTLLDVGPQVD